jgi:predicted metal-dependent hydrolase
MEVEVLKLFGVGEPVVASPPLVEVAPIVSEEPESPEPGPAVEIRVSARRRKTVAAHWEGETVVVVVPPRLSRRDRQVYADELVAKLVTDRERRRPTDAALTSRATDLSDRYLDGRARPAAVMWSKRQHHRWGSCSPGDRTIRVSDRLKDVPEWVLDAVLVHELAHLLRAEHDAEFHALVGRYPRTDDAGHFLAGYESGLARAARD